MIGVLLMAYGGPGRLEDVEPYLLDVRGQRPTPPTLVAEVRERYRRIGGRSPILEHTLAQAAALRAALREQGAECPVEVGMRHWRPRIADALNALEAAGVTRAAGLVMAPHDSELSVGAYLRAIERAGSPIEMRAVRSWHTLPEYLSAAVERVRSALRAWPPAERARVPVLFTAHSLPERILAAGDPYLAQLGETVVALRRSLPGQRVMLAFQSAGASQEPWLGPEAGDVLRVLAAEGCPGALIAPFGFTCEHVEILYDIDIEYQRLAQDLGMRVARTDMLNDDPALMRGLARRVREEMQAAGWW